MEEDIQTTDNRYRNYKIKQNNLFVLYIFITLNKIVKNTSQSFITITRSEILWDVKQKP